MEWMFFEQEELVELGVVPAARPSECGRNGYRRSATEGNAQNKRIISAIASRYANASLLREMSERRSNYLQRRS